MATLPNLVISQLSSTRLWGTVALLIAAALLWRALPVDLAFTHGHPWDAIMDWYGARAFWFGKDPYTKSYLNALGHDVFGHPPTTPFWYLWLAPVPRDYLKPIIDYTMLTVLIVQFVLIARELRFPAPLPTAALLFAATLSTTWIQYHLNVAQISEFIAFAYLLAWLFLRRGRDVAAGITLGLACTLKLFPGLLVLLLFATRRYRAFFAAGAAYGSIAVLMTARFGIHSWFEFLREEKYLADVWTAHIQNASLHGIVLRAFVPICIVRNPTIPAATRIATGIAVMLAIAFFLLSRRAAQRAETIDLPFALFATLSAFANPYMFEHYNTLLVLPLLLASVAWWQAVKNGLGRIGALFGGATVLVILWLLSIDGVLKVGYLIARGRTRRIHVLLHLYEVLNWLPAVLIMALLVGLLVWWHRRGGLKLDGLGARC